MGKLKFVLKNVFVSKIVPNPINPRGRLVRENDTQFEYLKASIKYFGVMVPLVVKEVEGKDEFELLDGERRYWACKEVGAKEVPAHVIQSGVTVDEARNIMFHIHTNREQWDACQQCKALEPVYFMLRKEHGDDEARIAKELVKLTGTSARTVAARLSFLRWPESLRKKAYADHLGEDNELYWTIVEIETQIIAHARKNFPDYFRKVDVDEVRGLLLEKYIQGKVHKSTEPRRVKCVSSTPQDLYGQHKYALGVFDRLVHDINFTFEEAEEEFLAKYPQAENAGFSSKKLFAQVQKVSTMLSDFDVDYLKNETERRAFYSLIEELKTYLDSFTTSH